MIQIKTILWRMLAAFALLLQASIAEEQHSVILDLNSTTLSGFVDTSASWWTGYSDPPASGLTNDFISAATTIDGNSIFLPATLTNATLEVGEPAQPQQVGSLWYSWQIHQSGVARISMAALYTAPAPLAISSSPALSDESIFYPDGGIIIGGGGVITTTLEPPPPVYIGYRRWSTALAVYRVSQNSLGETNFDFVARGDSLEFDVHELDSYCLAVEVYESGPAYEGQPEIPSSLPGNLYFDLTTPPTNDTFSSALSVADSSGGVMVGYTRAASRESTETDLGGQFSSASVWYNYTAATYGTVTISPGPYNIPFAVFVGDEVSNLKLIAKTETGGLGFFGEPGKTYHIAVYKNEASVGGFALSFIAPIYRLYETTVGALMPNGLFPHFYGVRGVTMLMYAKSVTGWDCLEIEPIVGRAADLAIYPTSAVDGQLRIVTIDESLPSPHVVLRPARGLMVPDLVGIAGQTCAVSFSTDLINWSQPKVYTLDSATRVLDAIDSTGAVNNYFYRVTQSMPEPTASISIGVTETTQATPTGVVITQTHSGGGGIPVPPLPLP